MKPSRRLPETIDLAPNGGQESREAMILSYLPLVRLIAQRLKRRLPPGFDAESLVHSGVVGLIEALNRYDPERGVSFLAYARHRIHGEMIQCLRSLDWVSRSVRFWSRRIGTVRKDLAVNLCREATTEEVAAELGLSLDAYHRVHAKLNESRQVRFEDPEAALEAEQMSQCDGYERAPYEDPFQSLERRDLEEKLREAIQRLPERERRVVELHHREELTLREIGRRLCLTEGRICQIYSKARRTLRELMSDPR